MKIAHIVCRYPPYYSGMGNVVFETAQELIARGHEVAVYTPSYYEEVEIKPAEAPEAEHASELTEEIDHVERLTPQFQYGNAARMGQLKKELEQFDIVHLHYPFFGTANIVRRWKLKNSDTPLVITYHMDTRAPDWRGLIFKLYTHFWMPKILRCADAIIGSSFDFIEHSDAKNLFYAHRKKWLELPFGVDANKFQPREKPRELCRELQLDPGLATLLFVGSLDRAHYFKGIPVLIEALTQLKYTYQFEPQVIIAGDGDLREQFETRARNRGLQNVRFIGYVPDDTLPLIYNMADLFILPSINQGEAFGLVLLEAMASGVPVISSNLPGVRTIAELGGLVVSPNDKDELAQGILGYFKVSEEDRTEWRQRARQIVEEQFSWQKVVGSLEALYADLIKS